MVAAASRGPGMDLSILLESKKNGLPLNPLLMSR